MAAAYRKDEESGLWSDSIADIPCQPCSGNDKSCQATHFCVDCQDYLCHGCMTHHKVLKITRNHSMMTLEEKEENPCAAIRDKCTEKCSIHTHKTVKYYCVSHGHLGCSLCATTEHKKCPNVKYIPSVAEDLKNDEVVKEFTEKFRTLHAATKCGISITSAHVRQVDLDAKLLKLSFDKLRHELNFTLDKLEKDVMAYEENIRKKQTAELNKFSSVCQVVSSELHVIQKRTKELAAAGQNSDAYVYIKKSIFKLQKYSNDIVKASVRSAKVVKFEPSTLYSLPETFEKLIIINEPLHIDSILKKLAKTSMDERGKHDGPKVSTILRNGNRVRKGKE